MITFETLQLVKEIITQLLVYYIILISKNIIIILIDLRKQQVLDADLKAMHEIYFTVNL